MIKEKLIRDKIKDFVLKERNETLNTRVVAGDEFIQFLKQKVIEEAYEIFNATSKEDLAEEIADLLEVLKNLSEKNNIVDLVFSKREDKLLEKGGFESGTVLITESNK